MWHQISNFLFPNISVVPMAFQYNFFDWGPFINNVRTRGEGRGLTYLVKLIKERRGRGSKNAPFARTLFMNGPLWSSRHGKRSLPMSLHIVYKSSATSSSFLYLISVILFFSTFLFNKSWTEIAYARRRQGKQIKGCFRRDFLLFQERNSIAWLWFGHRPLYTMNSNHCI